VRASEQPEFLPDHDLRPVTLEGVEGLRPIGLALGHGTQPLEVVITAAARQPGKAALERAWERRHAGRAVPVLLVVLYADRAAICGPAGDQPPAYLNLDRGLVERLCSAALAEPDRHAALRFLRGALPEIESPLPGLRNEGLLATHELEYGVPRRSDWRHATGAAAGARASRGEDLLRALGFEIEHIPGQASMLLAKGTRTAVAVLLHRSESPDVAAERFSGLSPVSYALHQADQQRVPYVIVTQGPMLRLYPVETGVGVGRRGRTETFVELHLDLLPDDKAGYLWLLFSAEALARGGSFEDILERSGRYAADLGHRLRDRIYRWVIPDLALAIWKARGLRKPSAEELSCTYEMALTLLFRLLFVAYAEDQELLPYRTNALYRARSLKQKARDLLDVMQRGAGFDEGTSHWGEVWQLFRAVDKGHREWGVPPYDGQLFSSDGSDGGAGARLASIALPNSAFGIILAALLLDETPEGRGPVDFRSLGVREFGTIYEGLLESELSIADTDLAVDREGVYRPAGRRDSVAVKAGQAYLHNRSGARNASGSFFTKPFAVEHLIRYSLEPALVAHIERLRGLSDREAGEAFFDFRVADIAMGSGHFLVAAVDHIERALSSYLAERPLPSVRDELQRLRAKAQSTLGQLGEGVDIEDTQLLRRQIARRCIFGVDINPLAVQLARTALWIHTFVPGLPLSFLDRNLVVGNSLVGIATFDEARDVLAEYATGMFLPSAEQLLAGAREPLQRLARLSDADAAEIKLAQEAWAEARAALRRTEALLDVLAAARLDGEVQAKLRTGASTHWAEDEDLSGSPLHQAARKALSAIPPFHFPIAFPEVFLRDRPGFDCILGNPPWKEATVERDRFWIRHAPGIASLPQREQEALKRRLERERPDLVQLYQAELAQMELLRQALTSGAYPGMGTGDPDVYKAFCWRFWRLLREGGHLGVVLPRSACSVKGSREFRATVLANGTVQDITFLLNRGVWVFDDQEPRYTSALFSLRKVKPTADATVPVRGPYASFDRYQAGAAAQPHRLALRELLTWTDTAALPVLPAEDSIEVFLQLRKSPRLDLNDGKSWRARAHRELDATNEKHLMNLRAKTCPEGYWPVFKGESFDIWTPDTGRYYAYADPRKLLPHLQQKRLRSARLARSAFSEFPREWLQDERTLPCLRPRIAFRDVTNRTNQRTVVVALLPPQVFITNAAPFLLWPRGDVRDAAYLLAVLSSLPLDWYSRRFVETHLNFHIFDPMPVPRPQRTDRLWQRGVALAGRLACPDERFAEWAEAVGVKCGLLPEDQKQDMIHELDAVVAHLYGLSEPQLRHIFETFHEGWDYEDRLRATLRHYHQWRKRLG